MGSRWFTFVSGVSLLLCGVVVAGWVRSHFVSERVTWHGTGELRGRRVNAMHSVTSGRGQVRVLTSYFGPKHPNPRMTYETGPAERAVKGRALHRRLGFSYYEWVDAGAPATAWNLGGRDVSVPYWLAAVVLAMPATLWLAARGRRRRRWRRERGLCVVCGYDLRATPARCPECGAAGAGGR